MAERLKLEISSPRARVVCGEGLPVDLILRNLGDSAATVAIGPSSPMVFELRTQADGPVEHTRSRLTELLEGIGDRSKPLPPDEVSVIAAGEALTLSDDPAAGSASPIPAGHYELTARWRSGDSEVVSNGIPVIVDAPRIGHLATLSCVFSGSQAQAFDALLDGAEGGPTMGPAIYQRETATDRADAAVFRCRATGTAGRPIDDLVLAAHLEPRLSRRWLGWLQNKQLFALVGPGPGTPAVPQAAPVELVDPILAEPALQRASSATKRSLSDWGEGLFHVVGSLEEASCVQRYTATREAVTAGPAMPLGAPAKTRVLTRASTVDGTVLFVWAQRAPGTTRVFMRHYSRELQPLAEGPVAIYERHAPLLALEMEPVSFGPAPGYAHALFGPEGDDPLRRRLMYVRIPLGNTGDEPREFVVPAPGPQVGGYAISGSATGGFLVLAKVGSEVWCVAAAGSTPWRPHMTAVPSLQHLRLVTTPEGYWAALGVDPGRGVICVPDPEYSHER